MKKIITLLLLLLSVQVQGQTKGQVFEGMASYYASRMHGHLTASGEPYNMHALTCAHKTLPFGTRLLVTNLRNGMQVTVKVNDRGPFVRGRIVDLSSAAAKEIGMLSMGVARVRVEVVAPKGEIWLEDQDMEINYDEEYLNAFKLDPPHIRLELQTPDDVSPWQLERNLKELEEKEGK